MTSTPSYTPDIEEAAQRVRALSDQVIDMAKQNGLSWLEASEKVLESMLRLEQQAGEASQVEWVNTLATTHADFVREMSKVYLDSMRERLK